MFIPLQLPNIEPLQVRDFPHVFTPIMMVLQKKNARDTEVFPQFFYVQATHM